MSKDDKRQVEPAVRLALRPKEAAVAIGVSERTLWTITQDQASGIPFMKIGRSVLYPVEPLRRWLAEKASIRPI